LSDNSPVTGEMNMSAAISDVWNRDLPPDIAQTLDEFRAKSVEIFGSSLTSLLLFGSAAEGRLRATSDVNVVMVFSHLDLDRVKVWRSQVELLVAAIGLQPLILLEDEISAAAEAFAVKYFDILHRRRVLHGADPFATLTISDAALQRRVSQVLLNLALRLRHTLLLGNDAGRTRSRSSMPSGRCVRARSHCRSWRASRAPSRARPCSRSPRGTAPRRSSSSCRRCASAAIRWWRIPRACSPP
jgi:predicted nucleotidyltransferase